MSYKDKSGMREEANSAVAHLRGERQKVVTEKYKENYDRIFNKNKGVEKK